jgi:hypothetical protein
MSTLIRHPSIIDLDPSPGPPYFRSYTLPLDLNGRVVTFGIDPFWRSYFASLFEGKECRGEAVPVATVGYDPLTVDVLGWEDADNGAYPATANDVDAALIRWGIRRDVREQVARALASSITVVRCRNMIEGGLVMSFDLSFSPSAHTFGV